MNKYLIEINENYGAIIDDEGNIRTISKKGNECFEQIAAMEDELEENEKRLEEARNKYELNNFNIRSARLTNSISIVGGLLTGIASIGTVPGALPILVGGFVYGFGKSFSLLGYGTIKSRKRWKESLEEEIPRLERENTELSIELWDLKRKSEFKEEENIEEINNLGIPFNFDQITRGEKTKVKVKALGKRR